MNISFWFVNRSKLSHNTFVHLFLSVWFLILYLEDNDYSQHNNDNYYRFIIIIIIIIIAVIKR